MPQEIQHSGISAPGEAHAFAHRPDSGSVACELAELSFGAVEGYAQRGGQAVISDDSPASAPLDLAVAGLRLPRDAPHRMRAIGAFVIRSQPRIRVTLTIAAPGHRATTIRAINSEGQVRVGQTTLVFNEGVARADLPITGIRSDAVGMINESWIWQTRAADGSFTPIVSRYASAQFDAFPIRMYFTAARAIGRIPRQSFYHVACAIGGASSADQAQRDVWRHFTSNLHGTPLANASGQTLNFWRDQSPGTEPPSYISRDAQALIMHTDSSCLGWADLFREALAIHGIPATIRALRPKLTAVHPRYGLPVFSIPNGQGQRTMFRTVGILVKPFRWKPAEQFSPFPFTSEQCVTNFGGYRWKLDNPCDPNAVRWPDPDTVDLHRPARAAPTGRTHGLFANHAVVLVKQNGRETWYDPSFGFGPHDSLLSYENELLGRGEENPGGIFAIVGWKRKQNPGGPESCEGLMLGAAPAPSTPILEALDPA